MNLQDTDSCPRCGARPLRSWRELNDEEREVIRRLPASADFTLQERIAARRWCSRCWHEEGAMRAEG